LLINWQRLSGLAGQPGSPARAEQVAYWWAADQVTDQHRVDLVLLPGAMPYQLAAAGDQPTLGWCARGALPHLGQACRQQLGKGLSVGLVGLLAALADPMDRLRVGQGYPSDPTAQDRGDRQGIAGPPVPGQRLRDRL
jgi:hypothetical protein